MYTFVGLVFISLTLSIAGIAFLLEKRLTKGRTNG
jgi:ABC-type amino acid transport system permease subunit